MFGSIDQLTGRPQPGMPDKKDRIEFVILSIGFLVFAFFYGMLLVLHGAMFHDAVGWVAIAACSILLGVWSKANAVYDGILQGRNRMPYRTLRRRMIVVLLVAWLPFWIFRFVSL
jgi:hypothetical protein